MEDNKNPLSVEIFKVYMNSSLQADCWHLKLKSNREQRLEFENFPLGGPTALPVFGIDYFFSTAYGPHTSPMDWTRPCRHGPAHRSRLSDSMPRQPPDFFKSTQDIYLASSRALIKIVTAKGDR